MVKEIMKMIGLNVTMRNFQMDYYDKNGKFYNHAVQTILFDGMETYDPVPNIYNDLKDKGYTLYSLIEVYGDFTMDELQSIVKIPSLGGNEYKLLYMDYEKFQEEQNIKKCP